jgi:hypothetical protein
MMKIYHIKSNANNKGFAILRPGNRQNVREVDCLDVWWDDWGSGGDKIGDFVFCYGVNVCKSSVFETLTNNFTELKGIPLRYHKTEKELTAKNPAILKWLPKEETPLNAFFSPKVFECLPESTVVISERGVEHLEGVAETRGNLIIPREKGKGVFFPLELIDCDFFTLANSNYLLCTERVKQFCEEQNYENIVFLEYGEIIPG